MKYANHPSQSSIDNLIKWGQEHPVESTWPHPQIGPFIPRKEPDFWSYKCWVQTLEVAEKDSGLEEFFAGQDLHFTLPDGFTPETSFSMAPASDLMAVDCITDAFTPHLFDDIRDFWLTADMPTANLESTVYGEAPVGRNQIPPAPGSTRTTGCPRFNTSAAMLDKFVKSGIRYFSTANNHSYDYDEAGLLATLDALDARGVYHSGTNRTPEEQEQALVIEVNGVRTAMLNGVFDLNGREYEKKWLINEMRFNDVPCEMELLEKQIADAKRQKADVIVLHAHWDWEFELYPHVCIVDIAHRLCEMGVDIIVGTHPHVLHPIERYCYERDGLPRESLILYSLGDFVSYHPVTKDSRLTFIPKFDIVKGTLNGKTACYVQDLKILPVYILAEELDEEHYDFRLLRLSTVLMDHPADGNYRYKLQDWEREDLPRLEDILYRILLPRDTTGLMAE